MSDLPFSSATTSDGRLLELFEPLGSVGGGKLFRGRLSGAAGFARVVAIKMVDQAGADRAELGQRLRDEARLLGLLQHRGIVTVADLLLVEGRWAVVMEFVDGADLAALLAKGPLPPRVVAEIGAATAGALAAAHAAADPSSGQPLGLVHRNVTPSNVRVTPHGEVKLVGFGFARARFAGREAQTGYLAFDQAAFLAPERLLGQDTAAGDVYGLGAALASALLGENIRSLPPIAASHAAGVAEIRGRLNGLLSGSAAGAALVERVASCLVYAPEARPTARELEVALQELVGELPAPGVRLWAPQHVRAYAPPPPPPVVPPPRAEGSATAGLVIEQVEASRRAEPRPAPRPRAETPPPTPRPRAVTPPPKSALAPRPPAAPSSGAPFTSTQRAILLAVLGGAALAFFVVGAVLVVVGLRLWSA